MNATATEKVKRKKITPSMGTKGGKTKKEIKTDNKNIAESRREYLFRKGNIRKNRIFSKTWGKTNTQERVN